MATVIYVRIELQRFKAFVAEFIGETVVAANDPVKIGSRHSRFAFEPPNLEPAPFQLGQDQTLITVFLGAAAAAAGCL